MVYVVCHPAVLFVQPTSSVIRDFLLLMSICHTVVPETDSSDPLHIYYQASSPGWSCSSLGKLTLIGRVCQEISLSGQCAQVAVQIGALTLMH